MTPKVFLIQCLACIDRFTIDFKFDEMYLAALFDLVMEEGNMKFGFISGTKTQGNENKAEMWLQFTVGKTLAMSKTFDMVNGKNESVFTLKSSYGKIL